MRSRLLTVLFWSVIAAAFIGPGTLVTASTAGASYHLGLVWTLLLAVITCVLFQEMAARLTIVTGRDLATTLGSLRPVGLVAIVPLGVVLGCIAYEAGNLLGAAIGLQALTDIPPTAALLLSGGIAAAMISLASIKVLVRILGGLVAVMGLVFLFVALQTDITAGALVRASAMPSVPAGSEWVILGLIGTTVVPYNFFLGSGLGAASRLGEMRFGLIISIVLGGIVSLAVLMTGTLLGDEVSLAALIRVITEQLGTFSGKVVALGVFAAGITSAMTAPLAAGFILDHFPVVRTRSIRKPAAILVIVIGMISGFLDYSPEAIILAAQAANGLALPLVAAFLWYVTSNSGTMQGEESPLWINILSFVILNILVILGIRSLYGALLPLTGWQMPDSPLVFLIISLPVSLAVGLLIVLRNRKG